MHCLVEQGQHAQRKRRVIAGPDEVPAFAFAHRVYATGGLPFSPRPQDLMEAVSAPDPMTLVISWRSPYVDAGLHWASLYEGGVAVGPAGAAGPPVAAAAPASRPSPRPER